MKSFFKFPCCGVPPTYGAIAIIVCVINIATNCKSKRVISAGDLIAYVNYPEMDVNCSLIAPGWFGNKSVAESVGFLSYEKRFKSVCNSSEPFYLNGGISIGLSPCRTITICNATYCINYEESAAKFTTRILGDACSRELFEVDEFVFKTSYDGNRFSRNYSMFHLYDVLINSKNGAKKQRLEEAMRTVAFNKEFAATIDEREISNCSKKIDDDLYFEGSGQLPSECQQLRICNRFYCQIIPRTATAYSVIFRRMKIPTDTNYMLPGYCTGIKWQRGRRRVIPFIEESADNDAALFPTNSTFGGLRFNLPGYRYCGPGTNIERMDDLGGPVNDLDNLCRDHDVAYQLGGPTDAADVKLLEDIWRIRHPYLPLFVAAFEAKRFYEKISGSVYTSSHYYFPEKQNSLDHTMMQNSVYDTSTVENDKKQNGIALENRWRKLLYGIWSGYCIAKDLPLQDRQGPENQQASSSSTCAVTAQSTTVASDTCSKTTQGTDEENCIDRSLKYPGVPSKYGDCRLLINEFATKGGESVPSFIELHRVCPPKKLSVAITMIGYHLLIIRIDDPSYIYFSYSLGNDVMTAVKERNPKTRRQKSNYFFVIGTANSSPNKDLEHLDRTVIHYDGRRGIPGVEGETYAIIVLHIPTVEDAEIMSLIAMQQHQGTAVPKLVEDEQMNVIRKYIQDIVIYGDPCPILTCQDYFNLIPQKEQVTPVNFEFIPIPYVLQTHEDPYRSASRCSPSYFPMQNDDFLEAFATPGTSNLCPSVAKRPFSFLGVTLQSSAQKVIVNAHNFFDEYSHNPRVLIESPLHNTASACSLHEDTVRKVLQNWRKSGELVTPGKKRDRPFSKQCQIDTMYAESISRLIQSFYTRNVAPFFSDIYIGFKQIVVDTEEQYTAAGQVFIPFTCGRSTFRKILKKLGFKFGKINLRDVILMRPDIVRWRGRYLNELRENRMRENPDKVIYLDETWIDPHARTGKAWVPIKCSNYRERAKYTFQKNKVSKGPRIIVLNAGGEDGMFHTAMDVFPVHKKDVTGDYHDNVNAVYYHKWFSKLLTALSLTGNNYIIVQDNAPYHGATEVPKQKDNKAAMYAWLQKTLPAPEKDSMVPIRSYRKFQLWDKIQELKSKTSYFTVDRMATDAGHRILRLPPYSCELNPIELVWKDVKDAVRKQNLDQNVNTITALAKKVMLEYPVKKWKSHVQHIKNLEDQYWIDDGFFETFVENHYSMIIPISDDDSDGDDEEDDGAIPIDPDVVTSAVHDDLDFDVDDELPDI